MKLVFIFFIVISTQTITMELAPITFSIKKRLLRKENKTRYILVRTVYNAITNLCENAVLQPYNNQTPQIIDCINGTVYLSTENMDATQQNASLPEIAIERLLVNVFQIGDVICYPQETERGVKADLLKIIAIEKKKKKLNNLILKSAATRETSIISAVESGYFYKVSDKNLTRFQKMFLRAHELQHPRIGQLPAELLDYIQQFISPLSSIR